MHFLLSSNIGEILTIFTAIIMRMPPPSYCHSAFVGKSYNRLTAGNSLGHGKGGSDIMDEKPETKGKSIFSGGMAINLILEGIMIAALSLTAYFAGQLFSRPVGGKNNDVFRACPVTACSFI